MMKKTHRQRIWIAFGLATLTHFAVPGARELIHAQDEAPPEEAVDAPPSELPPQEPIPQEENTPDPGANIGQPIEPPSDQGPQETDIRKRVPPVKRSVPSNRSNNQSSPESTANSAPADNTDDKGRKIEKPSEDKVGADLVPEGQDLVNIDFPEPTDIKDIVRAVSLWTGKNVILGRDVSGKVQMISPRKVTKVEAYQAFLSALNLLGLTTVETGKVIKIVPVRSAVKSNLKTFLGSTWTPMTDELITQIVPLKYISAKEIQTTLSRMVSSNAIISYPPTNTLIISDSGYKVRRILDIIELLDVQTQQPKVSIVPIKYGDAKAISALVQDIFKAQTTSKSSSSLSYKILTDERTNSVIIFGPPRTIADVKELVKKFDARVDDPTRQSTIHVRPLDYADAKKLATTLSTLASGGRSTSTPRRPPLTSRGANTKNDASSAPDVAVLDNDVKITADESSNSLLVTGSRAAYDAINSIIRKLDTRRSQVFVEAEILDINVGGGFKFATSIFGGDGKENGNKTAVTWQAANLAPLLVSQATNSEGTSSQGSEKAVGAFAEDLNIGILAGYEVNVPGIGKISPGALIKMIKTDAYTRVLSSPHILTSNNESAKIEVGEKLFFKGGEEVSTSGTTVSQVKHEDVSLSLEIKPNISHSNYVTMKIDLDANSGKIDSESRLPTILKRKTNQIVTVKNGQTVVISGLVKTSEIEIYQKIPLLGDIPILGWLFRNTDRQKSKTNLVIFLTPYIVHGANDLAAIYEKKVEERDEILKKIYGSDFQEDEFNQLLPRKEDGVYRADAYDVIDERRKAERDREMMKDLGYAPKDMQEISEENKVDASGNEGEGGALPIPGEGSGDIEHEQQVPVDSGFESEDFSIGDPGGGGSFDGGGDDGGGPPPPMDDAPPPDYAPPIDGE